MNCLPYARVSTDKQAQKDLSIPAQVKDKTFFYDLINLEYSTEYYPHKKFKHPLSWCPQISSPFFE